MFNRVKTAIRILMVAGVGISLVGGGSNGWKPLDFKNVQHNSLPIALFIYDPQQKSKNHAAELLEGKDGLDNNDVKEKLKQFTHIKIKSDQTDSKGWTPEWLKAADNGAILILASGDFKELARFDKSAPPKTLKAQIIAAADVVTKHQEEEKKEEIEREKNQAAIAAKRAPPPPIAAAQDNIPGIETTSKKNDKLTKEKDKEKAKDKKKDVEE